MVDICIAPAVPAEAAALLAYLCRVGGESDFLTFGSEGVPFTVLEEEAFIQQMQTSTASCLLVAKQAEEIVGIASLTVSRNPRLSHWGELGLSVVKAYWGQGIGSRLLSAVLDRAREYGLQQVHLTVHSDNIRAISLYRRFGFVDTGCIPGMLNIHGRLVDSRMMVLKL